MKHVIMKLTISKWLKSNVAIAHWECAAATTTTTVGRRSAGRIEISKGIVEYATLPETLYL